MGSFYHVDRGQILSAGQTLDLAHTDDPAPIIKDLYPDGLSRFGREYCHRDLVVIGDSGLRIVDGQLEGLHKSYLIDSFTELVRLSLFEEKPSRYQSMFCWEDLDAARQFIESQGQYPVTVWEIEGEKFHKADATLLSADTFVDGAQNAQEYWSGAATDNPVWEIVLPLPARVRRKVVDVNSPEDLPVLTE